MYKVLIISYYYPPMGLSGVQRVLKFTKYMKQYNWQPTVITAGDVAYFAHDLSLLKEAEDAGVEILRTEGLDINSILGAKYRTVSMPKEFLRKILTRLSKTFFIPDNKKSWAKKAYLIAKEKLQNEKFDMIFVSVPPYSQFVMASKLKKEFGLPLFVDYRDLWYGNHFSFYITPYHKIKHKKLEYKALKQVDKVVVINRKIKEKILLNYPFLQFDDIIIIPHGYDSEDFQKNIPYKKLNDKMKLTYSGIFYENITPEFFLKAFKELSIEKPEIANNIELEFIGHLRKENQKLINELGLKNYVIEYGYLEHDEVIKRIMTADVLWMMIGNVLNADTISTSKLYEYFGTRKPILASVPEGAAKQALVEYGASFITNPDYISEIKEAIINIYHLYISQNLPKPNEDFVASLDRAKLTGQLTNAFQFYLKAE